ncbi:MAG: hypothetical protein VX270_07095, partial [Actinomycetota bacterium]|nr:hypothetical protein [Actinomycetota bacterium]
VETGHQSKIVAVPTNKPSTLRQGLTPRNNSSADHSNHKDLLAIKNPELPPTRFVATNPTMHAPISRLGR